ncbi:hypothetical protein [Salmonirosea aquatica]|uniref:Lipocalin-like domain-containing protein n=1 Tax=Salmonirosea aquatica TaxID=2654236 RepID=A0A7C9FRL4_9BACT|nr:hypothetical protein [Cytophagaceae bacterium SJW1-29]
MFDLRKKVHPAFIYGGTLVGFLCLFLVLMTNASSPSQQIVGTWEEVSWEYEKADKDQYDSVMTGEVIADTLQRLIARDRIIHQAETWRFLPNGKLLLTSLRGTRKAAQWTLKGRGHVLFMWYNQESEESYDIAKITPDELVLHFHTDMQVRGIAKITFKKIR